MIQTNHGVRVQNVFYGLEDISAFVESFAGKLAGNQEPPWPHLCLSLSVYVSKLYFNKAQPSQDYTAAIHEAHYNSQDSHTANITKIHTILLQK